MVPKWQSPLLGFDPMDVSWLLAKSVPAALGEEVPVHFSLLGSLSPKSTTALDRDSAQTPSTCGQKNCPNSVKFLRELQMSLPLMWGVPLVYSSFSCLRPRSATAQAALSMQVLPLGWGFPDPLLH